MSSHDPPTCGPSKTTFELLIYVYVWDCEFRDREFNESKECEECCLGYMSLSSWPVCAAMKIKSTALKD